MYYTLMAIEARKKTNRAIQARGEKAGPIYARFFSSGVLKELARYGYSHTGGSIARNHHLFDEHYSTLTLSQFYDTLFNKLLANYRHEYIYKNAIAEKILIGRHSLNTAFMITEFRADNCKADAVVLNGTSHVYEIKSEYDSYERIDRQITAYKKIFDFITIITTEKLYESICERIPPEIGVLVLSDSGYNFRRDSCRREAKSNKTNVDPSVIFNSLRRSEYTRIISDVYGVSFDKTPNTRVYNEAKKIFERIPPELAHDKMVEALSCRKQTKYMADLIFSVPHSLMAASVSLRLTKDERERLVRIMSSKAIDLFV